MREYYFQTICTYKLKNYIKLNCYCNYWQSHAIFDDLRGTVVVALHILTQLAQATIYDVPTHAYYWNRFVLTHSAINRPKLIQILPTEM